MAGQHAFDLLLSDLGLPDGSGHDLMHQLRQRGHHFPGIALSGYGREDDIQRSYQAGFAAHLTKPASREAVVETIALVTAGEPDDLRIGAKINVAFRAAKERNFRGGNGDFPPVIALSVLRR